MSRSAPTGSNPSRTKRKPPVPPPGGWRPMEAAEILCPEAAALYRQGGEALEAAISQDLHRMSARANRHPELRRDAWLTLQLLDVLRRRPDQQLTWRSLHNPSAERAPIQSDIHRDACERDNGDGTAYRRWVHLDFRRDLASTGRDLPSTELDTVLPTHFADVQVEASSASPVRPDASAGDADAAGKPKYTPERCKEWLRWRVADHPKGEPKPTAAECWEAAKAQFSGPVPRDPFYELRKTVVPEEWQTQGPRGSRICSKTPDFAERGRRPKR